jgi:hypothetical protein
MLTHKYIVKQVFEDVLLEVVTGWFQEELKVYMSENPNFVPTNVKTVLTKEEKNLKERWGVCCQLHRYGGSQLTYFC